LGFSSGGAEAFARMQIAGQGDLLTSLIQLIWLLFLMIFILYPNFSQRLQLSYILRDLERKLYGLKRIREEVRSRVIGDSSKIF